LIVTARLEKWRDLTEQWLARNRVRVRELVMGPWKDLEHRSRPGQVAQFKAQEYAQRTASLFVESDPGQAETITGISGKPVICPAAGKVFS
jgi:uncharacterized HAD superfamily protein